MGVGGDAAGVLFPVLRCRMSWRLFLGPCPADICVIAEKEQQRDANTSSHTSRAESRDLCLFKKQIVDSIVCKQWMTFHNDLKPPLRRLIFIPWTVPRSLSICQFRLFTGFSRVVSGYR